MYNLRIRLECEVEFCASDFFIILTRNTVRCMIFNVSSEGLHNAEFRVFSKYVVDTYTPRRHIIHQTEVSPRACRTAEECAVFSIDVFNPDIPGFRLSHNSFTIRNLANPYLRIAYCIASRGAEISINTFVVSQDIPLRTKVDACISTPQIISISIDYRIISTTCTAELVIVYASSGVITEECFNFAIPGLQSIHVLITSNTLSRTNCKVISRIFFKFTITSCYSNFTIIILQFSTIEGIAILVSIRTSTAKEICGVTTEAKIPIRAAEIIINFNDISVYIAIFISISRCAIMTKVLIIRRQTYCSRNTVIDLCLATETDTIIPRIIIFLSRIAMLITVTETSITSKFDVSNFVFKVRYANAEVVQFVSIFIGQFVDQSALFNRCFVHVCHSFGYHFSGFITGNVALALEVFAINALNDTGVSQFYYGFVCPAIRRYVDKRVSCECTRCAYCHRCCQCC